MRGSSSSCSGDDLDSPATLSAMNDPERGRLESPLSPPVQMMISTFANRRRLSRHLATQYLPQSSLQGQTIGQPSMSTIQNTADSNVEPVVTTATIENNTPDSDSEVNHVPAEASHSHRSEHLDTSVKVKDVSRSLSDISMMDLETPRSERSCCVKFSSSEPYLDASSKFDASSRAISSVGGSYCFSETTSYKRGGVLSPADEEDEVCSFFTTQASPDSKYTTYNVPVDPDEDDRATEIPLYSFARPHMRAFHLAWSSFFVAFFAWFAMTPLLSVIADSLDIGKREIWSSSVLAVTSSAITRFCMGPLNDKYGARWTMASTLVASAIPTGLAGLLIQSTTSLYIVRFLIGVAGSAFVTCQYWTTSMFTCEVAGTANALAAGWGNLGGGLAQVVMGSLLYPLFKIIYGGEGYQDDDDSQDDRASELAWRTILVFPAIFCLVAAWAVVKYADDSPKGNVRKTVSARKSFRQGAANWNTWLLFVQYGCSFGVEITMIQAAALYFHDEFGQSTESAAAIASVFGWMNLFARGIGGFASDMANAKAGFRGRLWCQVIFLVAEGTLVILFSLTQTLAGAIVVMVLFSIFVQAAEGSTYGIVPYVDSAVTGSIAGVVGAGGNVGGVGFALLFRALDYRNSFLWMGCAVIGSANVTALMSVPGHRTLLGGKDSEIVVEHRKRAGLPTTIFFEASSESGDDPEDCGEGP